MRRLRERVTIGSIVVVLGALSALALVAVSGLGISSMSTMSSDARQAQAAQQMAKVVSHAYESWLTDDDQSNMYAAVLAVGDPKQHALAETTFAQAQAGYADAVKDLATLDRMATDPAQRAKVAAIRGSLAAYNGFTQQLRAAGVAGDIHRAIYVVTVANLVPSNALPQEFEALRTMVQERATAALVASRSDASSSTTELIAVAAIAFVLVAGLTILVRRLVRDLLGGGLGAVNACLASLRDGCLAGLRAGLERVASGDLTYAVAPVTRPIETARTDEVGDAARSADAIVAAAAASIASYEEMRAGLATAMREIAATAGSVDDASQLVAGSSGDARRAILEVANAIGDVATGAERQARMVLDARTASTAAQDVAVSGSETAARMARAMTDLDARSATISGFVQTIGGIAEQTNLLALNAAIEAARAGDHGRGFAVVADEVRKLAEESREAAATIGALVDEIHGTTSDAVEIATGEAVESFARIAETIGGIDGALGEIASVSEQTSAASQQVTASTQETTATADVLAAAADGLADDAGRLRTLVAGFTIDAA